MVKLIVCHFYVFFLSMFFVHILGPLTMTDRQILYYLVSGELLRLMDKIARHIVVKVMQ